MGDRSGISWTEATWNPLAGCTPVSEGCDRCYAARQADGPRLSRLALYRDLAPGGVFSGEVRLAPERLDQPLRWRRPRMVFVNSMSDLFHEAVPDGYIGSVFDVMAKAPHHTFQLLTKRHARMRSLLTKWGEEGARQSWAGPGTAVFRTREGVWAGPVRWPLPNVWIGVSVENQKWADIRIPALLDTPAAVRWLSCEPLVGPVDLAGYLPRPADAAWYPVECRHGYQGCPICDRTVAPADAVGWVVVGGETQTGARRLDPAWFESIQAACRNAGVPYHFKQTGEVLAREWGLKSRAGKDPAEWPQPFPREYPAAVAVTS